jgi:hypothetical protein
MGCWLTIEVQDADVPASLWRNGRGEALIEAAVTNGATQWQWHTPRWGVILEIAFRDEAGREAYRALPAVQAALDAVPDPVRGLYVYPGRGGGALFRVRRPHRPTPLAGAAAVEEPREEHYLDIAPRPTEEPDQHDYPVEGLIDHRHHQFVCIGRPPPPWACKGRPRRRTSIVTASWLPSVERRRARGGRAVGKQSIRQAARRAALDAQAQRRRERAQRDKRIETLAVDVLTALTERQASIEECERRAGHALRKLTEREGLSVRAAADWCGDDLTAREAKRLLRMARPQGAAD